MARILVSDKLAKEGVDVLKQEGFDVDIKTGLSSDELGKIIGDYDGIIIRSQTKITSEIISRAAKLKVIGRAGVGVDNVDVGTATKKGIIVMNAPGGNTISTCEHTFALILALARKIPFAYNSLREGKWERSKFKGVELYSKVLGVIGLGRIGREVVKRGIAFNMEVIAYDPFVTQEVADSIGVKLVELEELLKKADFVTLHIPLNDATKNFISTPQFDLMKNTAFLINCSRGGIVDEEALYIALKEKKISGAAVDVFSQEPPQDKKLFELDNIIFTPHLGASTEEAQINVAVEIAHCIKDYFLFGVIRNAVNFAQIDLHTYRLIYPYIELAEKMGIFVSQLINGRVQEIEVIYSGEISSYKVEPVSSALVKGFLTNIMGEDVNYINALELLRERKVKFEDVRRKEEQEYVNSIKVRVKTDKELRSVEGTLFSNRQPRFVKIDDLYIEIVPSQYMIFINNMDKPGTIGRLGTVLGKHNINIAGMSLGRRAPQDVAITILNIDNPLTDEVIDEITKDPNIISLKFIKL